MNETYQKNADNTISVLGVIETVSPDDLAVRKKRLLGQQQYLRNQADGLQPQIDAIIAREEGVFKTFPELAPVSVEPTIKPTQ